MGASIAGRVIFVVATAALAVTTWQCSSSSGGGGGATTLPAGATSTVIGASGGTASSSDGNVQVSIPAGAVDGNVTITVAAIAPPAAGSFGNVYEIGPTGTQFKVPVAMTFKYGGVDLAGKSVALLRVATIVD